MSHIVGYSIEKKPKWPYISAAIFLVFVVLLIYALFSARKNESSKHAVATTTTTTITSTAKTSSTTSSTFTSTTIMKPQKTRQGEIKIEELNIKQNSDGKIYCYSRVNANSVPINIHHCWFSPDKKEIADISLAIHRQPADTWSYVSSYGLSPGKYKVEVRLDSGKVLRKKDFEITPSNTP